MATHIEDVSGRTTNENTTPPLQHTNGSYPPLEKDFTPNGTQSSFLSRPNLPSPKSTTHSSPGRSPPTNLPADHNPQDALHRIRTAGSISISPELFEKLYLGPETRTHGDLRKTFANPTPMYVCFLIP